MPDNALTEDELHAALFTNMQQQENLTKALIGVELKTVMPVFLQHVNERAGELKEAIEALSKPEKLLAETEQEITRHEGKCLEISLQLAMEDPDERALTRMRFAEWDNALTVLVSQKERFEQEIAGLQHERNLAEELADKALGGLLNLASAIENPFTHPMAQGTAGYIRFRQLDAVGQIILQEGPEHPEYELAIVELRQLASAAGFDLVPCDPREDSKRLWDAYRNEKLQEVQPPSGADVTSATLTTIERALADAKANERIEDLRGHRTLAHATGSRDPSMDYQRLRDIQTSAR